MSDEVWRPVPGFEKYEASNYGRVRRISTGRIQTRNRQRRGYPMVHCRVEGETRTFLVHRAVWMAFHGSVPEGLQINHKDGDKFNSSLENLEVVTPSENILHALRTGLRRPTPKGHHVPPEKRARGERHGSHTHPERVARGERNPNAKLTEKDVREIRALRSAGVPHKELACRYGVSLKTVKKAATGRGWAHVL